MPDKKPKVKSRKPKVEEAREAFDIPPEAVKKIINDFHSEMDKGLRGRGGSLKMIPAFVDKPLGTEKGRFIALDLGGTNFRVLEIELKGRGSIVSMADRQFKIPKKYISGKGTDLFDFIARCIKEFVSAKKELKRQDISLGFTFSFPVHQTAVSEGKLLHWTKEFSASGVQGKDVVKMMKDALKKAGLERINIAALVNDTVGTLAACSYRDSFCDIGLIVGTGTNACYREKTAKIVKLSRLPALMDNMIVNIEWGGFNKLKQSRFDKILDRHSENPGQQVLEKMASGRYQGEIVRLIIDDLMRKKEIFPGEKSRHFLKENGFKSEYISRIEADQSAGLYGIEELLIELGITDSSMEDRKILLKVCRIVSMRAARIIGASLAAVVKKIDPWLLRRHTVAIDGSVYEKHPFFSNNMKAVFRDIFGKKSGKIKVVLAKDGSGIGAAVIAAAVASIAGGGG